MFLLPIVIMKPIIDIKATRLRPIFSSYVLDFVRVTERFSRFETDTKLSLISNPLDVFHFECVFSITLVYHQWRSSCHGMVLEQISGCSVLRQIDHGNHYIAYSKPHHQSLNNYAMKKVSSLILVRVGFRRHFLMSFLAADAEQKMYSEV